MVRMSAIRSAAAHCFNDSVMICGNRSELVKHESGSTHRIVNVAPAWSHRVTAASADCCCHGFANLHLHVLLTAHDGWLAGDSAHVKPFCLHASFFINVEKIAATEHIAYRVISIGLDKVEEPWFEGAIIDCDGPIVVLKLKEAHEADTQE